MKQMIRRNFQGLFSIAFIISLALNTTVLASDDAGNVFTDEHTKGVWSVLGPSGGDARAIAVDPKDPDKLYLSTMDGQIHISTDAGQSWRLLASFGKALLTLDQLFVDS